MTDDELRDLQESDHQLTELTKHPGWAVLVDYTNALMRGPQRALINGHIDSLEKYKFMAGELVGISKVLDAPEVVRARVLAELRDRAEIREES